MDWRLVPVPDDALTNEWAIADIDGDEVVLVLVRESAVGNDPPDRVIDRVRRELDRLAHGAVV